jgi:hydrogenase maturation protease
MRYGSSLSNNGRREAGIIPPPPFPPSLEGARGDYLKELQSPSDAHSERGEVVSPPKTVILGIGNVLLSDEGIGVHVANELSLMDLPPGVSVIEGGTDGFRLLNIITEADRLIVVDAVKGGAEPGSIYRFNIDEVRNVPSGFRTSVHQVGILEVIDLSGLIGKTPRTTVIGVEPKSLDMSLELSPEIKEKIPRIIELVFEEVGKG